jgi:predicted RNA binding protein YcfA (HicA-like mRNA interferase family)
MKRLRGTEFCRVLERHGWEFQRTRGSHHVYTRPGGPNTLAVPVHGNKTLPTGTQKSLMRRAGLTDDDL